MGPSGVHRGCDGGGGRAGGAACSQRADLPAPFRARLRRRDAGSFPGCSSRAPWRPAGPGQLHAAGPHPSRPGERPVVWRRGGAGRIRRWLCVVLVACAGCGHPAVACTVALGAGAWAGVVLGGSGGRPPLAGSLGRGHGLGGRRPWLGEAGLAGPCERRRCAGHPELWRVGLCHAPCRAGGDRGRNLGGCGPGGLWRFACRDRGGDARWIGHLAEP